MVAAELATIHQSYQMMQKCIQIIVFDFDRNTIKNFDTAWKSFQFRAKLFR